MRLRIFYGWYIVGATVLISAFIGGMGFYGFTALVNPLAISLGWSYSQISLAMSVRGLEAGILSPFLGKVADRWPARWLILAGAVTVALGYLVLSRVNSLAMFYVSFMLMALGASLSVTMAPMVTAVRWFKKDLGKANGIISIGAGIGGLTTPIITRLIDAFDWRITMVILGGMVAVIGIPLAFVFRSQPQDYGMLPDGAPPSTADEADNNGQYDFDMRVEEAIMTRAFWFYGMATFFQVAANSAVILHIMPYLASLGVERAAASMVAMFVPLVSIPARLVYGWLADIFPKKYVLAASNVLTSIGLIFYAIMGSGSTMVTVLFVVFFSCGLAGFLPIRAPMVKEYFGTANFGTILGITFVFLTLGSVISPPIAGWVYDLRGVYHPFWLVLSGINLIAAVLMLAMPFPPQRNGAA